MKALLSILMTAGILAGCGGSGSAGTAVSGSVVKGPVSGADVCVYALDSNGVPAAQPMGACAKTGAGGAYTVNIAATSGNYLITASGGTYTNEATGTPNVPLDTPLKTIVSANGGGVTAAVTPLTSVAVNYLSSVSGGTLAERYAAAAAEVLQQFALNGVDINAAPNVSAGTSDPYGRVLRAIAKYLDGSGDSGALAALLGWDESSLAQLQSDLAAAYASANADAPAPTFGFSKEPITLSPGGNCSPVNQSAFFSGLAGARTLYPNLNNSVGVLRDQFDGAASYTLNISANGALQIAGDTASYTFQPGQIIITEDCGHETNVVYRDAALGYDALLQLAQDGHVQFNIYEPWAVGKPTTLPAVYMGSTDPDATVNVAPIAARAGAYTVASTDAGAHSRGSITIGTDGSIDFDSGKSFTAADIMAVSVSGGVLRVDIKTRVVDFVEYTEAFEIRSDGGVVNDIRYYPYYRPLGVTDGLVHVHVTASGGSDPAPDAAVGLASPFNFSGSPSDEAIMQIMAGEYDVGIVNAPDAAQTGPGKLVVAYAGSDGAVTITLKDANGAVLASRSSPALSDRNPADGRGINLWDTAVGYAEGGRRLSVYNYFDAGNSNASPLAYAQVSFVSTGHLVGNVGLYEFRNGLYAYGSTVPPQFATLAGSYTGIEQTLLCGSNSPVNVDIGAGGSIRIRGLSSLTCAPQDVTAQWDGLDDFILVEPSGQVLLKIDSRFIGGSQPGGGVTLKLTTVQSPEGFTEANLTLAGGAGGITTVSATRN